MGQPFSNNNPTSAEVARLDRRAQDLVQAALDPKSRQCYERVWRQFELFCDKLHFETDLPISETILLRFMAHLYDEGYAASTINSAMSALTHFHVKHNLSDPRTKKVQQALLGIKNLRPVSEGYDPFSLNDLNKMIGAAQGVFQSKYTVILFQAMASLAFYALLRVGEFTHSQHNLRRENITLHDSYVAIRFQSFKHSGGIGVTQSVSTKQHEKFCPVKLLGKYLEVRGDKSGFLFVDQDGKAPSRKQFLAWMREVMVYCDLDIVKYNTHSFRAGMATHMALQGFSAEQIKLAGRWSSDAYRKYIRISKC